MHAWGLRLRGVLRALAIAQPPVSSSAMRNNGGTPVAIISQLNTPACMCPCHASMAASRLAMHDSGSGWFATPFLYDSSIHYSTPVYPGALRSLLATFRREIRFLTQIHLRRVSIKTTKSPAGNPAGQLSN